MTDELKIVEIHSGREICYAMLSRLFLDPPSEETYKMLDIIIPSISYMADSNDEELKIGFKGIENYLAKRKELKGSELKEYDLNNLRYYTRIFCLTDSVPISESFYTSVEKLSMQKARDEVMLLYKNLHFTLDLDSNEPEDHIALELMFMSYLAMLSKNSIEKGNDERFELLIKVQREFLKKHLLVWIDEFLTKVAGYDESEDFYLPLMKFTVGYIKEDSRFLE